MPRHVDRAQRRRDITAAAMKLLAERGPAALTLRELAREMGGSITLITHFCPSRAQLLEDVTAQLIDDFDADLAELETDLSPEQRLRVLLEWMLPLDDSSRDGELARIMLLGSRDPDLPVQGFFDAMEAKMRGLLHDHVRVLVAAERVEPAVEALRVFTNGVVLSAVEHPAEWPPQRQLVLLDQVLAALGLLEVAASEARYVTKRRREA